MKRGAFFLNNGQILVRAAGRGHVFEKRMSMQNIMRPIPSRSSKGYAHSVTFNDRQIGLIWRVSLAGSMCHVNGVKIGL